MHEYNLLPEQHGDASGECVDTRSEENAILHDEDLDQKDMKFRRGLRVLIIGASSLVLLVSLLVFMFPQDDLSSHRDLVDTTPVDDMSLQLIIPSFVSF